MALGGGKFFCPFRGFDPSLQQLEGRGMTMDWTIWLALIATVTLVVYLAVALLAPEKFS